MALINPAEIFKGNIIFFVPHMDDGVLACGGTIAKLPHKDQIHIVYATDGMASPAPVLPWRDSVSEDLGVARTNESLTAMGSLGISKENIHFLNFADGRLKRHSKQFKDNVSQLLVQIRPVHVFVPFRYDCHPDHLALHRVVTKLLPTRAIDPKCHEYFVYYRFRLLPRRDVRQHIHPLYLREVDITNVSDRKRKALDCFTSQTTIYYTWQTRPNLSPRLLDQVSRSTEVFLNYDPSLPGPAVFKNCAFWIRFIHTLEPLLKKRKDQALALLRRGITRNDRIAN